MRRNNTRSETKKTDAKEDPPLLLADKRERPVDPEAEKPNECADGLCTLLGVLLVMAILLVGIVLAGEPKKMEPAGGQTQPVVHSPAFYGSKGPEDHTTGILSEFRDIQRRFAFIENLEDKERVDQETLTQFKAEMDRLENFLVQTRPGDRLPDHHRVVVAEKLDKIKQQLEAIEETV